MAKSPILCQDMEEFPQLPVPPIPSRVQLKLKFNAGA